MSKPAGLVHVSIFAGVLAACALPAAAQTSCTGSAPTVTCSGAAGLSVAPSSNNTWTGPSPSKFLVSGVSGTVTGVSLTLTGLSANGQNGQCLADSAFMLLSPDSRAYYFMNQVGATGCTFNGSSNVSALTLNVADGNATAMPNQLTSFPLTGSASFKPGTGAYPDPSAPSTLFSMSGYPGGSSGSEPAITGSATFTSVFTGAPANGLWSLYLGDYDAGDSVAITGWNLTLTVSASAVSTTTSVSSNTVSPAITGNAVVYTATVSSGSGTPTGTVTFTDTLPGGSATNLCSNVPVSGGQAVCSTGISAEGNHLITANFSGTGGYSPSSGTLTEAYRKATTNPQTLQFCNSGTITMPGQAVNQVIYPSYINVTGVSNSVATVSVNLQGLSGANGIQGVQMMLVSPDGKALEFLSEVGLASVQSSVNLTLADNNPSLPNNSNPVSGTYQGTAYSTGDSYPAPAPSSFGESAPGGTKTFAQVFNGATANGNWLLYVHDNGGTGEAALLNGGWCINLTVNSGASTTTTVAANPIPAAVGQSVTLTATVLSNGNPVSSGNVTFEDNGTPLNVATAVNGSGVANISTNSLTEGDHTITATYNGVAGTYNPSYGTVSERVNNPTTVSFTNPGFAYCNTGAIAIPASNTPPNDIGAGYPNPSYINVANLPGTVSSMTMTLNNYHATIPNSVSTLLVGPSGTNAQAFDLFSGVGDGVHTFGPGNITLSDAAGGHLPNTGAFAAGSYKPTSYLTNDTYTASPFFTLPSGPYTYAPSTGSATFASVYSNLVANGPWTVYFNQNTHVEGGGVNGGWCLTFTQTAVTGTGTTTHTGPAPSNHMVQGGTGSVSFSLLNNGNGPTGDPDGNHPMTVTGTLPAGLTLGTVPTGSPWNCTANTTTQVTCLNHNAIAQGSSYTLLSIPVVVASNAPASVTISGFTFSGAGMTGGAFASDTITIDPAPVLSISKSHTGTFTQGSTATWNLQVTNTSGTAAGATSGTTTVVDTLPSGYTVSSTVSSTWDCSGSTTTVVTCTSTQVVAGAGGQFPLIAVNVNIPSNSPVSVTNNALAYGGGDLNHTNSGNAATTFDTATVVQVPASILLTAGNNQSVAVNTAFPTNLSVTVKDAASVAISGVTVTFTAPASGASGTFAGGTNVKTATTNGSGVATATVYTSNTTTGSYSIGVAAGSVTNTFSETNIAGPASTMSANAGTTPQSTNVNTAFSNALAVTVKDAFNNPVSGVTVTFTAPGSGASGTFSNSTATTSAVTTASGIATATIFTANGTAGGPYNVTAAATGLTTVNFSLTNNGTGPVVTTNPTDVTVNAGQMATFTAAASGSPTPTVQWQVSTDGGATYNNLAGATTTTLSFTASAGANGNKYRAVFTNTTASATTTAATLTVNFTPTVTTNPVSQSVSAGSIVSFSAAASGNPAPTVQWQQSTDGGATFNNISGATSTTLSFTTNASQNGNQYRAVFTNSIGSATTTPATLTVTAGPVVTTNPTSVTVSAGGTAVFTAAASGTPTPTVQWQVSTDGGSTFSNLSGATTTTLSLAGVSSGMNGNQYRAVFTNTTGNATSTAATLTVNFTPTITTNPVSQSVSAGSNVSFSAAASGNPAPTVQWQQSTDGGATFANISGATSTTLSFTTAAGQNGNQYRAVFTNSGGSATTSAATLTVTAGPVVTLNPTNVTVNAGQTATFTAAATGTPTPTVQWQVSTDGGSTFTNVSGATTTTLSFVTTAGQNGYKYHAVFTNTTGPATTTAATLTVNFTPAVTTNPVSQSVSAGSNVSFSAAASGNPAPTVQWQQSTDGGSTFANISGATSTTLSFATNAGQNGYQYRAVFTNSVGSATTAAATLSVTAGPVVTLNPVNQTVNPNSTATFTAAATGTPTPTVQWQVSTDGGSTFTNVSGATTTTLSFNAQTTDNGKLYRAVFTNLSGTATTTAASLTVNSGPTVVSFKVLWGSQTYNVIGTPRNRLPWQITGIQVVFSAPITSGDVNSLTGAGITTTGFSGLGTNTLTWTINPLSLGTFAAALAGTGPDALQDANNIGLGNGAGFSQNLKILYGDFNDDGVVNAADQSAVLAASRSVYNLFADLNGDGIVSVADVQIVRTQIGNTLP